MGTEKHRDMDFSERASWFHELFDDANDPGITLVALVRAAGEFLTMIVGEKYADVGMKRIIGQLASDGAKNWRQDLVDGESGAFSEWELGSFFHDLEAYGRYGIDINAREHEEPKVVEKRIAGFVEKAEQFLAMCPIDVWLGEERSPQLETTISLARNRWALDNDRPVEPDALAIFGGVSAGRMRNLTTGKTAIFNKESGFIPAHEAHAWLAERDDFFTSIWRDARPVYDGSVGDYTFVQPIFVPVARDGSVFHPGLERRGGFTIGPKESEYQAETYEQALRDLQEMPSPAWRRPHSKQGGWGIVQGINWERFSEEQLDQRARSELSLIKSQTAENES